MSDPSIDQLRVLQAVVATGSFSAAARALNRAQSAVTYAIQKLEEQAGLSLFDRRAYRPQLTDAGQALLISAAAIVEAVDAYRAVAQGMASGLEAELVIVVEAMFPMVRLAPALHELQRRFPTVQTRLRVESLGSARDAVMDNRTDLGLIILAEGETKALRFLPVADIELVAVAAAGHALAQRRGALTVDDMRAHLQIVFSDRTSRGGGPDRGVMALRTWRVADLGAKHSMLLAGLGWGSMPLHVVEDDLAQGRLVKLQPVVWGDASRLPLLPVMVAHRRDRVLGTAGAWLFGQLARGLNA